MLVCHIQVISPRQVIKIALLIVELDIKSIALPEGANMTLKEVRPGSIDYRRKAQGKRGHARAANTLVRAKCHNTCIQGSIRLAGSVQSIAILLLLVCVSFWLPKLSIAGEETPLLRHLVKRVPVMGERQMLRSVCDQGSIKMYDRVSYCSVCPSYTSRSGDKEKFAIVDSVLGSFTSGHEEEVLLNMKGCESEANLGGGMVLLRHAGSGWSRLHYQKGSRLRDCLEYPMEDDKYTLICNQSVLRTEGEIGHILWVNASADGLQVKPLLRWYDNVTSNPRRLVSVFPSRFQRTDFNQDGYKDVHIMFRIREETIPQRYTGAINAIDAGYELDVPRILGMVYLFDGKSFALDENSIETLAEINALLSNYLPAEAR